MKSDEIVIFGASGQAKNIAFIIEQIGTWNILGFVEKDESRKGETVMGYSILGDISALEQFESINVALAIGNPSIAEKIMTEIKQTGKNVTFPNLIHPSVIFDKKRVQMGEGNIINAGCVFTTDIEIGNFNYFNRLTGLSHDTVVGDFCFFHTGAAISGSTAIGNKVQVGTNVTIIQGKNIGDNALLGAGSVILKDVEENAVIVGNPGKVLRYQE